MVRLLEKRDVGIAALPGVEISRVVEWKKSEPSEEGGNKLTPVKPTLN